MKMLKKLLAILALGATGLTAFSQNQTNLFPNGTGTTLPYYSISNTAIFGSGAFVVLDPISSGASGFTNNYANGTNYAGGTVIPVGVNLSRIVSIGIQATSTNASDSGVITAYLQGGTGLGDWGTLTNIAVTLTGVGTVSSSIPIVDTGGWTQFRLQTIGDTDTHSHVQTVTVSIASKRGF